MSTGATKEDFGNGNTQETKSHRIVVGWREEASKYTAAGSNTSIGRYVMICSTPLEKKNLQVLKNRGAGSFRLITITHSRQGIPNLLNSIKRSIKILYISALIWIYNYAFYRKLVKMSRIRLLGDPPRLLQYYMGGVVSRDPKFELRNIWTVP